MKELIFLARHGWRMLLRRGKIAIAAFISSLVVLAVLDAAALFIIASILNPNKLGQFNAIQIEASLPLIISTICLFISRSVLSALANLLVVKELAREESELGHRFLRKLIHPQVQTIRPIDSVLPTVVDRGPQALYTVLLQFATLVGESVTAIIIAIALVIMYPLNATLCIIYFVIVVAIQHAILGNKTKQNGQNLIMGVTTVYDLLSDAAALKRVLLDDRNLSLLRSLEDERKKLALARGLTQFLSLVPRYFFEIVLVVGLSLTVLISYAARGVSTAMIAAAIFTAAGFRLLPIINRIQSLLLSAYAWAPSARLGLEVEDVPAPTDTRTSRNPSPNAVIEFENVSARYLGSSSDAVSSVSLELEYGNQYAIVGPSGAGKTTIALLALDVLRPRTGEIRRLSNLRCAYVPQSTHLAHLSLAGNIAMSWDDSSIDLRRVEYALNEVGLSEFVDQIDNPRVLSNETLSGGQKQRIGLARAFYHDANFIVFDEVTSSLDSTLEFFVVDAIKKLRGHVTTLVIAHRLTTIRAADHIFYVTNGHVSGSGTFEELRRSEPMFESQVNLSRIEVEHDSAIANP